MAGRMSIDEVYARVQTLFESKRLRVIQKGKLADIPFELVAYRNDEPCACVAIKYAVQQNDMQQEGQRFGRMRAEKTLAREFPQILDYLDSKDPWNSARASAPPSN